MRDPKSFPKAPRKIPFLFIGAKLTVTSPLDKMLDLLSYRSRDFFKSLYCICYNIASMFFGHKAYEILVSQSGIKHLLHCAEPRCLQGSPLELGS